MDVHRKGRTILMPKPARCLHILHPATVFLYLLLYLLIIFVFNHPAFIITAFALAVIQAAYFCGAKAIFSRLKLSFLFGALIAVITPIFNRRGRHVLFYLIERPFTLEALCYGFYMMFLIMGILTVFVTFNSTVSPGKFLYLFSKAAPQTSFIMNMTLRFGAVLKSKGEDYLKVQATREHDSKTGIIKLGILLSSFALWSLEDGIAVSETLRAKEYGVKKRTHYNNFVFTHNDVFFIITSTTLFFVSLIIMMNIQPYDYLRSLTDVSFNAHRLASYILVLIYMMLPLITDCSYTIRSLQFQSTKDLGIK